MPEAPQVFFVPAPTLPTLTNDFALPIPSMSAADVAEWNPVGTQDQTPPAHLIAQMGNQRGPAELRFADGLAAAQSSGLGGNTRLSAAEEGKPTDAAASTPAVDKSRVKLLRPVPDWVKIEIRFADPARLGSPNGKTAALQILQREDVKPLFEYLTDPEQIERGHTQRHGRLFRSSDENTLSSANDATRRDIAKRVGHRGAQKDPDLMRYISLPALLTIAGYDFETFSASSHQEVRNLYYIHGVDPDLILGSLTPEDKLASLWPDRNAYALHGIYFQLSPDQQASVISTLDDRDLVRLYESLIYSPTGFNAGLRSFILSLDGEAVVRLINAIMAKPVHGRQLGQFVKSLGAITETEHFPAGIFTSAGTRQRTIKSSAYAEVFAKLAEVAGGKEALALLLKHSEEWVAREMWGDLPLPLKIIFRPTFAEARNTGTVNFPYKG